MFKRFVKDRKGVAEIVGTVMFVMILIFFFTNVYLWHDAAVKERDSLSMQRLNSRIEVNAAAGGLVVNNTGGVDVALSRLWIKNETSVVYIDIKDEIDKGNLVLINQKMAFSNVILTGGSVTIPSSYIPGYLEPNTVFKVITTLGSSASDSLD